MFPAGLTSWYEVGGLVLRGQHTENALFQQALLGIDFPISTENE